MARLPGHPPGVSPQETRRTQRKTEPMGRFPGHPPGERLDKLLECPLSNSIPFISVRFAGNLATCRGFLPVLAALIRTGQKALRWIVRTLNLWILGRKFIKQKLFFLECRSSLLWCLQLGIYKHGRDKFGQQIIDPQPVVQPQDSTIGRSEKHKMHLANLILARRLVVKVLKPYAIYFP